MMACSYIVMKTAIMKSSIWNMVKNKFSIWGKKRKMLFIGLLGAP